MSILKHTNIPIIYLKKLDNFFKNQNIDVKNDIFIQRRNEFFRLKNENQDAEQSALEIAAFYISIKNFYELKEKAVKKNKTLTTSEIKRYDDYLIKTSKKNRNPSIKENFLLDKSSILNNLIAENRSLREISVFLKKRYKIDISHSYIKQIIDKYPNIFKKESKL